MCVYVYLMSCDRARSYITTTFREREHVHARERGGEGEGDKARERKEGRKKERERERNRVSEQEKNYLLRESAREQAREREIARERESIPQLAATASGGAAQQVHPCRIRQKIRGAVLASEPALS